jgi:cobyrinic acid a,c-diamide synthase
MAAWTRRGRTVASCKVGPDFIDPGYHRLATGRTGRNLDSFLCGTDAVPAIAAKAAAGADVLVVEGVMGLFDGLGTTATASTAEAAALLDAPVVLVVDASSMSTSVRALVSGYDRHLEEATGTGLAGVVLNRVGSTTHEELLREALEPTGVAVLGVLRRDPVFGWRDRHLGLVPVVEDPTGIGTALARLTDAIDAGLDLEALDRVARGAPARIVDPLIAGRRVSERAVPIAVLGGPAFSFSYPDNLERLEEAGAEIVPVDPFGDAALPPGIGGLYACGGFPEVFAAELSANHALMADARAKVAAGLPTWAECGGLLWLSRSLDGHELAGVIDAKAVMGSRVVVGYRTGTARCDSPVAARGTALRGHEHHYSSLEPGGTALELVGRAGTRLEGWATSTMLATYLHMHLGGDPGPAARFVAAGATAAG